MFLWKLGSWFSLVSSNPTIEQLRIWQSNHTIIMLNKQSSDKIAHKHATASPKRLSLLEYIYATLSVCWTHIVPYGCFKYI